MNTAESTLGTKLKVGIFSLLGLLAIGAVTVFVNDKPFWWRPCQLVHINVEDATGLKTKSPIQSLGLQIGYLDSVELSETYVRLGICVTAPVEVLPTTRAYIRGEGFLGDKFVELKPVRYLGRDRKAASEIKEPVEVKPSPNAFFDWLIPSAYAESDSSANKRASSKEIPVGTQNQDVNHLVQQVDGLVNEMTALTNNLKEAIHPEELRKTMLQLNKTLENASRTLSPEGGLNTTAQRTLEKLEDTIEHMRDQMARVNKGEGSVGMLLNDPSYALQVKEALRNVNKLLTKVGDIRFLVDIGGENIPAYEGGRGWFRLSIYPKPDRYYLLGVSIDPRGKRTVITTTTTAGGQTGNVSTTTIEQGGILFTAMLGKVLYRRFDFSIGVLHGDGTVSGALRLGPEDREEMLQLRTDFYSRGRGFSLDDRLSLVYRPWMQSSLLSSIYLRGGLESIRTIDGKTGYFYGAGLTFDDEDIKLLFALR